MGYEPLGVNRRRNPNVSAEILGGFTWGGESRGTRYAIITLDGTIMLVDNCDKPPMESIMWNLQVDHQLMCLSRLDMTGDGLEKGISLSSLVHWPGMVDEAREMLEQLGVDVT